jgi:tRNA U34 5-methylaminomethyl-2-thiouridine-forming methyltransferase MnmC
MKSVSFRVLEHANGSKTLVDDENGQAMHSRIGPEAEARMVYADLARVEEALDRADARVVLWDVGMGIAANVLAVLDRIRDFSGTKRAGALEIVSFESKPEGLRAALERPADFPMLERWRAPLEALSSSGRADFRVGDVAVSWSLVAGDFLRSIETSGSAAPDVVLYDFYSPKVVPELWSRSAFASLRARIGERDCRLFTYSAASPTRLHLLLAGFFVGEGVSTGVKGETTVAATRFERLERPLRSEWLLKLETSASIRGAPDKESVRSHPQWKLR